MRIRNNTYIKRKIYSFAMTSAFLILSIMGILIPTILMETLVIGIFNTSFSPLRAILIALGITFITLMWLATQDDTECMW